MASVKKNIFLTVGAAIFVVIAGHGLSWADDAPAAQRYGECLKRADTRPKEAFEDAIAWRDMGGGPPAEHCAATALIQLGLFADAAKRLEDLARRINKTPDFKADLLGQAAQAWLLAERPGPAAALATAALNLDPDSIELRIDRAQARAATGDFHGAISDLNQALARNPRRYDALTFRSSAKRRLKNNTGALTDVNAALAIKSNHPEALLERGILHRLNENKDAARADWMTVLNHAPKSAAADAARANLEKMDVKVR